MEVSKKVSGGFGVVCLNIVSSPGPDFVKVKARLAKARLGQVGDQVEAKDKVGQGQGHELDNIKPK